MSALKTVCVAIVIMGFEHLWMLVITGLVAGCRVIIWTMKAWWSNYCKLYIKTLKSACLLTESHMKRGSVKSAGFYLGARDRNSGKQSGVNSERSSWKLVVSIESLVRAHLASRSCSVFLVLSEKLLNEGQQHNVSCHIWQNNPKNKCITLREDSKDSFQFNCPFKEFRKWLYCLPVIIILMRRKHDLCCGGQISSVWLDMIQESSTFPSRLPEFTQIK